MKKLLLILFCLPSIGFGQDLMIEDEIKDPVFRVVEVMPCFKGCTDKDCTVKASSNILLIIIYPPKAKDMVFQVRSL